jgi:cytochrome P450
VGYHRGGKLTAGAPVSVTTPELECRLTDRSFVEDPYATYRELRACAPVLHSEALGGWLVTGYDEVRAALHDYAHLSSFGWELRFLERLDADVQAELPELFAHFRTRGLIYSDPPAHTRLRRLVGGAFGPKAITAIRPHIEEIVDELLAVDPADGGFDVIRDLAYPLPTIVIAELFGVPREDRGLLKGWSRELTSFFGSVEPDSARARVANASLVEFRAYLRELIAARRTRHRDDVLSALVIAQDSDDGLALGEILNTCVILLVAGHETTTNLIGNAVLALVRHPEELAGVRPDPERIGLVVEETLRWDGPVQRVRRMVVDECELGGEQLSAGDAVYVMLGAANRDPAAFPDPDRFWPGRPRTAHIAFGLGVHFCLGAALARAEAPIAIGRLLGRFPALRLPDGWTPEHNLSLTLRGLTSLPLLG